MSTRVEVTRFPTSGPIQATFMAHMLSGWQWHLWRHIHNCWNPPAMSIWAFKDTPNRIGGIVLSFDCFDTYMHHLAEGDGRLVEYVFAWIEGRSKWVGISLNCDGWEEALREAVFTDGGGNCRTPEEVPSGDEAVERLDYEGERTS